ncbi:hypothetical protein Tco_0344502 [Tanacetum coccineum]
MADHLRPIEELLRIPIIGAAEARLENEPPCSITTWDDLVSKFLNRLYPHSKTKELRKEITNFQQVFDFFYNGLSQSDQDSLNSAAVSSSSGSSTQIDAITALTKQVEALGNYIGSMQETNNRNQEATIQLMQNQMGQMVEAFQERPLGVLPSNTKMNPLAELNVITTMDGLSLDGSLIPHSNFLVYQEEEQEPKTITEVVEIPSSHSTPLVPPLETSPSFSPKPKKNLEPNPQQPSIPYPSRLQEENFQDLENPTGRANHFVYRIDIVVSLCDKFPIENNSLSGNPTSSSDSVVESLSPSPTPCRNNDSLMEETDTLLSHFNDSSPDYETFCFDINEKSSGSTTPHSDHSLLDYEAFCFDVDHQEEKSSGSTTSHSDLSLPKYESFHFDLSIDPLPPADRSDSHHKEFVDELAHIISSPKYDRFYFDIEPEPGELTRRVEENISEDSTKELTSPELNNLRFLLSDCDSIFSKIGFPFRNKDKNFDPGIFIIKGVQSLRFIFFHWTIFYYLIRQ